MTMFNLFTQPGSAIDSNQHDLDNMQSQAMPFMSQPGLPDSKSVDANNDFISAMLEKCFICKQSMIDDVSIASCGHMYHSAHIKEWRGCPRCPGTAIGLLHQIYYNPLESLKARLASDDDDSESTERTMPISQVIQDALNEQSSLVTRKHNELHMIEREKSQVEQAIHESAIRCKLKQMEIDQAHMLNTHLISFNRTLQSEIALTERAQQALEVDAKAWYDQNPADSKSTSHIRPKPSLSFGITEQRLDKKREQRRHLCGSISVQIRFKLNLI